MQPVYIDIAIKYKPSAITKRNITSSIQFRAARAYQCSLEVERCPEFAYFG